MILIMIAGYWTESRPPVVPTAVAVANIAVANAAETASATSVCYHCGQQVLLIVLMSIRSMNELMSR